MQENERTRLEKAVNELTAIQFGLEAYRFADDGRRRELMPLIVSSMEILRGIIDQMHRDLEQG